MNFSSRLPPRGLVRSRYATRLPDSVSGSCPVRDSGLCALFHPGMTEPWVQVDIGLIHIKDRLLGVSLVQGATNSPHFLGFLRIFDVEWAGRGSKRY